MPAMTEEEIMKRDVGCGNTFTCNLCPKIYECRILVMLERQTLAIERLLEIAEGLKKQGKSDKKRTVCQKKKTK
jgi:hypothetical protein